MPFSRTKLNKKTMPALWVAVVGLCGLPADLCGTNAGELTAFTSAVW